MENWNLRIYVNIFETTFFKRVTQNFMFDFRSQVFQIKAFCIFCISSINCFENEVNKPFVPNALFLYPLKISENRKVFWCFEETKKGRIGNKWVNVRYIILDSANVLKIILFLSRIFLILHNLKTFCILVILFKKFSCICNFWS